MDDSVSISAGLQRAVVKDSPLARYMKSVPCDVTPFKKGDTFYTVDLIKQWVNSRSHHTEQLAPELEGATLRQTADNIYRFLYRHVQYKADATMQNLLSPGCAWNRRFEGLDCKSFSIFASSILTNLGIQHAIRQVRQPSFYPEQFTHVYVVVPHDQSIKVLKDQKTYVIDATKHENTEVIYLEKKDILMLPHQGLGAARPSKTLCSFAGKSLKTARNKAMRSSAGRKLVTCRGLNGAPEKVVGEKLVGNPKEHVVTGLNQFVNYLIYLGIPERKAQEVQDRAVNYLKQGIDPNFIVKKEGIQVGEHLILIADDPKGLNGRGLGIAAALIPLITSALQQSGGKGEAGGGAPSAMNIGGIFNKILGEGGGIFGGTLGAVFANGFNLSCWNASMTPSRVEQEFKPELQKWMLKQTDTIKRETNPGVMAKKLTEISKNLNAFKTHAQFHLSEVKAKCSKEANGIKVALVVETLKEFDKIVEQLKQYFNIEAINKEFEASTIKVGDDLAVDWKGRSHPSTFKEFRLSAKSSASAPSGGFVNVGGFGGTSSGGYAIGGSNVPTTNFNGNQNQGEFNNVKSAGFPWLPAIAILGAGGSALYFANKKK